MLKTELCNSAEAVELNFGYASVWDSHGTLDTTSDGMEKVWIFSILKRAKV
jgi:hypothetical protein